jgi:hypothetical protein
MVENLKGRLPGYKCRGSDKNAHKFLVDRFNYSNKRYGIAAGEMAYDAQGQS